MSKLKTKTVICLLLDETGSMASARDTTISAVNEYLAKFRGDNRALLKLVTFNSEHRTSTNTRLAKKHAPLTRATYHPRATTPLYDAIADTAQELYDEVKKREYKYKVLFVILTDGFENSSRRYSREQVFELIKGYEIEGWTFVYLGANQDAWAIGATLGISRGNTTTFSTQNMVGTMTGLALASVGFIGREGEGYQEDIIEEYYDAKSTEKDND